MVCGCKPVLKKQCHIHGVMPNEKYENVWVYFVPYENADSIGIDSVQIKNSSFDYVTEKNIMSIIRVDYHYRYGLQDLLVVTEPGDVNVKIDSVSSAHGTPQNDSLDIWKNVTIMHQRETGLMIKSASRAYRRNDTILANSIKNQADSIHKRYKRFTRRMGNNLKEGVLHDFLLSLYPTSYKKKMPDGSIVTVKDE